MTATGATARLAIAAVLAAAALGGAVAAGQGPDRGAPLVGLHVQRTERVSYAPAQRRTWAVSDLHTVLVVSGDLTVVDARGRPQVYPAGASFAAGWEPYAAMAPAGGPVETVVTVHAR